MFKHRFLFVTFFALLLLARDVSSNICGKISFRDGSYTDMRETNPRGFFPNLTQIGFGAGIFDWTFALCDSHQVPQGGFSCANGSFLTQQSKDNCKVLFKSPSGSPTADTKKITFTYSSTDINGLPGVAVVNCYCGTSLLEMPSSSYEANYSSSLLLTFTVRSKACCPGYSNGLSRTEIIAISVGVSVGLIIVVAFLIVMYRRRTNSSNSSTANQQQQQQQQAAPSSLSSNQKENQPLLLGTRRSHHANNDVDDDVDGNVNYAQMNSNLGGDSSGVKPASSSSPSSASSGVENPSSNKKKKPSSSSGVKNKNENFSDSESESKKNDDDDDDNEQSSRVASPTAAASGAGVDPSSPRDKHGDRFRIGTEFSDSQNASAGSDFAKTFDVLPANYKPAHSAEDSCRKIMALLTNPKMTQNEIDDVVSAVKRKAKDLIKLGAKHNLSKNELDALVFYTSDVRKAAPQLQVENNVWHFLNKSLGLRASQHFFVHSPLLDFLAYLTSGVKKLPAASGVILWRAVPQQLTELSKKQGYSTGTTICFPGFTSVSRDSSFVLSFAGTEHGSIMSIISSAAYSIKEFSMFPHEEEMLLLPNSFVQVTETKLDVDYQSDVTVKSLGTVALPKKLDIVHLTQLDEAAIQKVSGSGTGVGSKKQIMNKPIEELDEDELSLLLQSKKVATNILSCMKNSSVNGTLFSEQIFVDEMFDQATMEKYQIVPLALKHLKRVHQELISASSS